MVFFLSSQKITIPKHIKKEKVFSLINAGWIVKGILYIFLNINRINQLYLSNNEVSCYIYVKNIYREKLCFTQSNRRIY